jgi:hypothetical protein
MEILYYITNVCFVLVSILRFYKFYISKEIRSLIIGIVILFGSVFSILFHTWIALGLSLILLWILSFTQFGRNRKKIIFICISLILVATYVWFFKSRYNERIEFVKPIVERMDFDSIPVIDSAGTTKFSSPYIECFVSDEDKYLFNVMNRIDFSGRFLSDNLGFFSPPDSLKTIFFFKCNRYEGATYSGGRYKGSFPNSIPITTDFETFDVQVFVYDCDTKVIVACKNFIPPHLKESYSSEESPKQLDYSNIHDYVLNLLK